MSKIEFGGHTQYSNGGYSVIVNNDGSILVQPDDWLSKYSMAIYGDFNHIDRFLRRENGLYKEIENVDLIVAGETLYHKDVVYGESPDDGYVPPGIYPVPREPEISPKDLTKRVIEIFEYLGKIVCPVSDWQYKGSAGGSIGIDTEGIKLGVVGSLLEFMVGREGDPEPTRLRGASVGATGGVDFDFGPISFSIAPPSYASKGFIFKLPGAGATLSKDELEGGFVAFELSGSAVVGGSLTLILFGIQISDLFVLDWTGPARLLLPLKGGLCTAGLKAAGPDLSVTAHWGYLLEW